jgi:hypothetical protein
MKLKLTCFAWLMVFALTGSAFAQEKTIVFIPKSTSATFYLFLVKGAADKAKELGYKIQYLGPATEADVAAQVDFVRTITKRKPFLIVSLGRKTRLGYQPSGPELTYCSRECAARSLRAAEPVFLDRVPAGRHLPPAC